jgi:NADPH:quinone reductase-like Zn-dependent oxidoreductase
VFGWDLFPAFGAYAEYKRMRASGILAIKPANVDYAEAAAIPYGGLLALSYLKRGNIQAGQRVLVYGASGAVGTLAVQLSRHFGAKVTGVCSTMNLELVKSLGADSVMDYTREQSIDKAESYDLILDAVGERKGSPLKQQCRQALAPNGKYISVDDGSPTIGIRDLVLLKELVEAGKLKPVIDRRYPLEQMAEAHRYVDQGHKKGNVVITVAHGSQT